MEPVHVQRQGAAAIGEAWARCVAAAPPGWMVELVRWGVIAGDPDERNPRTGNPVRLRHRFRAEAQPTWYDDATRDPAVRWDADTEADALDGLTAILERVPRDGPSAIDRPAVPGVGPVPSGIVSAAEKRRD